MSQEWPSTADVTAALESNDPTATADPKTPSVATDDKAPGADAADVKVVDPITGATKPTATPPAPSAQQPAKPVTPPASPSDLAARIKEDPRKFLATVPEDAIEAMQAVLYPKLHRTLSKRDEAHRAELARERDMSAAQVANLNARFDEILQRTMEPEAFEEYKRQRDDKVAADKAKNAPSAAEAARQAEIQAYVTQTWDMIADAGLPIPEDRTDFSDMTEEVKTVWQAGWNEKNPLAAVRAMRAKIREIKSGAPAASPATPPRDPNTGRFVKDTEIAAMIAEGVKKALEENALDAGLAITGARPGGGGAVSGKAQTWEQNRKDMADALRSLTSR